MRKSPDNIKAGNSKVRTLINLLIMGVMLVAPASNPDRQPSKSEAEIPEKPEEDMFEGLNIVPDSTPMKFEKKEDSKGGSIRRFIEECGDCELS